MEYTRPGHAPSSTLYVRDVEYDSSRDAQLIKGACDDVTAVQLHARQPYVNDRRILLWCFGIYVVALVFYGGAHGHDHHVTSRKCSDTSAAIAKILL